MLNIGINYLVEKNNYDSIGNIYDNIYSSLIKKHYINLLKYPGRYCNLEELQYCIDSVEQNNIFIDIHGFPVMIPVTHNKQFCSNIKLNEIPQRLWNLKHQSRISTHIVLVNHDRLKNYSEQDLNNIFHSNIDNMKEKLFNICGTKFEIGGELQPGGFDFDKATLCSNFIGNVWKEMDFGVFDITHAKLICNDLNFSLSTYLENLKNKDKVKIIHIAGNTDITNSYSNKPDKHVLTTIEEFYELNSILKHFNNVDSIISEYAYSTRFHTKKELCIEVINLYFAINNISKLYYVSNFIESELEHDASNLEYILSVVEKLK